MREPRCEPFAKSSDIFVVTVTYNYIVYDYIIVDHHYYTNHIYIYMYIYIYIYILYSCGAVAVDWSRGGATRLWLGLGWLLYCRRRENMVGANMVLAEFIKFVNYSYLRAC